MGQMGIVAAGVLFASPHPQPAVRVAYEVHGSGPVNVLFVPGMCISRRMWDQQLEVFSRYPDKYTLCLLDNRGAGDSDIPPAGFMDARNGNYATETLANDAWVVANHVFGPDAKVHVVGWSMGSMIAQRVALLKLDRIASLALISGSAGGWYWSNFPSTALAHAAIDILRTGFDVDVTADVSLRLHYTNAFLEEYVLDDESGEKRPRREHYRDRYRRGRKGDALKDVEGHAFWGHLATARGHNLSGQEADALRDAPFECLVIYGEEDRVVVPRASRDLGHRIGASLIGVAGAHMVVDESAHEVNQCLAQLWITNTCDG